MSAQIGGGMWRASARADRKGTVRGKKGMRGRVNGLGRAFVREG